MMHLLLFVAIVFGSIHVEGAGVVEATDKNFDSVIKQSEIALVKFYAPWCGHCQKLAPEWEKAAKDIPSEASMIDVDCTKETGLAQKYSIKGYPTIILFRGGEQVETYRGARQSADLVDYVKANVGPAVMYPSNAEELSKIREEHDTVCVGLTSDAESALSKALSNSAKALRMKMKFALVTEPQLLPDENPESVLVYRKGDEKEVYDGKMEETELKAFLETAVLPFSGEINPSTYMKYAQSTMPVAWVLLKPNDETSKELKSKLLDLGKKMRRHVVLLWVDAEQYAVGKSLSVPDDAKYPAFAIAKGEKHYVLPPTEAATAESIEAFIMEYAQGNAVPSIKSQPVPEKETVDGLTTIVASTFEKYLSSGKDILIEFFAPWCGHCKNFANTYAKVAKEFESSDVIIAVMDATANDVDKSIFDVSGFPTVYFIPHGEKPILYSGDRTFYEVYKFVREHSSVFKNETDSVNPEDTKETEADTEGEKGDL
ncbi:protein disulfide isomerase [Trypanosoma grayi]|uniref:protein disulfide isomerase n=1 Tax=Trypanosoma grayi TaxID=71804 RepID=UPI0004F46945|nr:protein disulfide isomerase [Trypanosoma grayi]KEG13152.1 protein disulfide isomerase [Trypanosoma grayi]